MKALPLLATASLSICGIAVPAVSSSHAQNAVPVPSSPVYYETQVKPILSASCYKCHTEQMASGLRLDSREAMLKGGDSGAAIIPGDPSKSLLVEAVHQSGDLKMPPKGKLDNAQIAIIETWIKAGAVWSGSASSPAATPTTATPLTPDSSGPALSVSAATLSPVAGAPTPATTVIAAAVHAGLQPMQAQDSEFFENKVRPILANNCNECHAEGAAAGLRLDSREALLKGGDSGPAIVAGDPAKSLLMEAVNRTGHLKMPKGGAMLSDADRATLGEWVKMGAP